MLLPWYQALKDDFPLQTVELRGYQFGFLERKPQNPGSCSWIKGAFWKQRHSRESHGFL